MRRMQAVRTLPRPFLRVIRHLAALLLAALWLLPAAAQDGPVVVAHYMPWFQARPFSTSWGWHWTMNRYNPETVGADGQREIASHYHPTIGPYDSRDPDVIEYHALLMRIAGIDGVAVDWYGTSTLYDYPLLNAATNAVYAGVGRAGLRFAVCYEDASIGALVAAGRIPASGAVQQARTDLAYVRDRWTGDARTLTHGGAPVVLTFGPQYLRTSAEWTSALSVFPTPPAFVTEDARLAPVAAGAYPWPPMWASVNGVLTPARLGQYLDTFYAASAAWPLPVGGAFTGFHDIYAQAGVGTSYGFLGDRGGQTLAETLERAAAADVPIVQIATWNDFGEGTMIEPTVERGTRDLETVQAFVRARRALPFAAADFDLPLRLYRFRGTADAATDARLDDAAGRMAAGDPAGARAVLDALGTTASEALPAGLTVSVGPTPSRGAVVVAFTLPEAATVQADVFDAAGRRVARLVEATLGAGSHRAMWTGTAAGTYVVRLKIGAAVVTRRVVLAR